jgi:hypothetical protein
MRGRLRAAEPRSARLVPAAGGLAFESTYDPGLVAELKLRVPYESRSWDSANKRWLVEPQYGAVCAALAMRYLGIQVTVPTTTAAATTETRLVRLEYLGRTKDRGNGERSAFGWVDGAWTLVVPEEVLRDWFDAIPQQPGEKKTLYAVLMLKAGATADEIKSAYRRMARQWHPDVCKEPDAAEQFKVINHAYQVLSDELQRRKYDAGLQFEASLKQGQRMAGPFRLGRAAVVTPPDESYRSPLRCGWVLCEGKQSLGRFVVSNIRQWEDIVNEHGQAMVASWPMGATVPEVAWQ